MPSDPPAISHGEGDRATLIKMYRSLIRSKLDYGSQFYGYASQAIIQRLDIVHNSGIRLALGAFRSSPIVSMCIEAGEPPLKYRRLQLALQRRLWRHPESPTSAVVFADHYDNLYVDHLPPLGTHCRKLLADVALCNCRFTPSATAVESPWRLNLTNCCELCGLTKNVNSER